MEAEIDKLKELAISVSNNAYAPYSKFPVGCVIVTKKGHLYSGCNIENISFGLTICAERAALSKAISEEGSELKIDFVLIFTPTEVPVTSCGACRQVLREFGNDFEIVSFCKTDAEIRTTINQLLPQSPEIHLPTSQ